MQIAGYRTALPQRQPQPHRPIFAGLGIASGPTGDRVTFAGVPPKPRVEKTRAGMDQAIVSYIDTLEKQILAPGMQFTVTHLADDFRLHGKIRCGSGEEFKFVSVLGSEHDILLSEEKPDHREDERLLWWHNTGPRRKEAVNVSYHNASDLGDISLGPTVLAKTRAFLIALEKELLKQCPPDRKPPSVEATLAAKAKADPK